MTAIRIFTTAFPERDPARRAEYAECLTRNIECVEIDAICVLVEGDVVLPPADKILVRTIYRRPHYVDYLRWIADVAGPEDISIIANADIFFDTQVGLLRFTPIPARSVFALSRWDAIDKTAVVLNDRNDSQDAWAFRGVPDGIHGDFPVGVPRCDNRFAKELELAGYAVLNPSFSLRSYHLHSGVRQEYSLQAEASFVDGPYGYVWPHNLLPLHRTVAHNLRHRKYRVGWRLDTRYWKRKLKFHWILKGLHLASKPFGTRE
jgi:hypothetical protein